MKVFATPINPSDIFFMKGDYDQFDLFKIKRVVNGGDIFWFRLNVV